jgi:dolichol-phosphate mannosyltransferase
MPTSKRKRTSRFIAYSLCEFPPRGLVIELFYHSFLERGSFFLFFNEFNALKEKNKYIRGLISWMGFKQAPCYYEREKRFAGETKYPFQKMLKFAMIGLFYFSKKPLKVATSLGLFCVLLGLAYVLWTIISHFILGRDAVLGWTSTIALIVFFGGVQLLTIGVLGQYIGNIFDEAKGRPEYIVSEKINL